MRMTYPKSYGLKSRRAQIVIEYILLVVAVLLVFLVLLKPGGIFQERVNGIITSSEGKVQDYNDEIIFK